MIQWARPLVACQINSVNWRGGHQNGHARLCVHCSLSAGRSLFSVFKLSLLKSGIRPHGERLTSKVRISVGAAFKMNLYCYETLLWLTNSFLMQIISRVEN
ncbi:hypothetical protein Y032_0068g149 [Ancylostoma ceylanicum]|uniref:Uncharacterized protein n=1 Tax=Ancylostoma ceylanicum TaxID=53326 RepID=A0A016TYY4_9BILA|nr:hypothetical protein Y032_0068g149 [Ancylostoma ceylanicum]